MSLSEKLHPSRFTAMSGKMSAILGYVLGQSWTKPEIRELHVTCDGGLLARIDGDIGCNDFIGSLSDWEANLRRLFKVADVTPDEQREFAGLWREKVRDWREAMARA